MTQRVIDQNGGVQRGLYFERKGTFFVKNQAEYDQYIKKRDRILSNKTNVEELTQKVLQLEKLVEKLTNG